MRAGSINLLVDVEQPRNPPTVSGSGAVKKEWDPFASGVWAKFTATGGGEKYGLNEFLAQSLYTVEMRALPGLTTAMRLVMGVRTFDIVDADDLTDRFKLVLRVKEGRSKGN